MKKNNINSYFLPAIYILLIVSILSNISNPFGSSIGNIIYLTALLTIGVLGFSSFLKNPNYPKYLLPLILYFSIVLIGVIWTVNIERSIIHIIQVITILLLLFSIKNNKQNNIYIIFICSLIYVSLIFLIWVWSGFEYDHSGLFNSRNTNGAYIYYVSYFLIIYYLLNNKTGKRYVLLFILILILLIFIRSRSIWLSIISALFTYYLWPYIHKNKIRYNAYFILVLFFIGLLISIYLYLATSFPEGRILNQLILEYTGGQLFSGRDELWPILIQRVNENIIFGYGPGVLVSDFVDIDWAGSAHNLYIQTLFQTGLIGVIILISLFYSIWRKIRKLKNRKIGRLLAAFFISMLIHQTFEVSFTQNLFVLGLLQWFIIFYSINYKNSLNENSIYSK